VPFFVGLAVLELAVPRWAELTSPTNWHPHHIAERYGLFTIILFGESVLAASNGVGGALEGGEINRPLIIIAGSGLVLLFALWWLYFLAPVGEGLNDHRHLSYQWGYGHYGIFVSLAALGAGLEVAVGQTGHDLKASPLAICYAVAIPTALFVMLLWMVHTPILTEPVFRPTVMLCGVIVILLLPLTATRTGVVTIVAAIAAACVLMTIATIVLGEPPRSPTEVGRRSCCA
jgi:low temperature requirement protein LtrA